MLAIALKPGMGPTSMSNTSSQSACLAPTRRVMYLFLRKVSLPDSLILPPGQSRYRTGVWLSSSASVPYTAPVSGTAVKLEASHSLFGRILW